MGWNVMPTARNAKGIGPTIDHLSSAPNILPQDWIERRNGRVLQD
jgi:hypothetical protein